MTVHELLTGEKAPLSIEEHEEWMAHDILTADEMEFERAKSAM